MTTAHFGKAMDPTIELDEQQESRRFRPSFIQSGCASALGLGLLLLSLFSVFVSVACRLSWWSTLLVFGVTVIALALSLKVLSASVRYKMIGWGGILILAVLFVRVGSVRQSRRVRLTVLPNDSGASVLSRLLPESDGALAAAWLLESDRSFHDPEANHFSEILREAYERTTPKAIGIPTPAIRTYLGLQHPDAFDLIVIQPSEKETKPDAAVIFLHGYAGNFYVYCWEFAQAASESNLVTMCPSMDAGGAWWTNKGHRTFETTLKYANKLGFHRVYLAGLSNGAAGASVLALEFERSLTGVVLVSGGRAPQAPSLPVLVVQGAADSMMPAEYARTFATRNPAVQYREVQGGHLVFLSRHEHVRPVIAEFLRNLEGSGPRKKSQKGR